MLTANLRAPPLRDIPAALNHETNTKLVYNKQSCSVSKLGSANTTILSTEAIVVHAAYTHTIAKLCSALKHKKTNLIEISCEETVVCFD